MKLGILTFFLVIWGSTCFGQPGTAYTEPNYSNFDKITVKPKLAPKHRRKLAREYNDEDWDELQKVKIGAIVVLTFIIIFKFPSFTIPYGCILFLIGGLSYYFNITLIFNYYDLEYGVGITILLMLIVPILIGAFFGLRK